MLYVDRKINTFSIINTQYKPKNEVCTTVPLLKSLATDELHLSNNIKANKINAVSFGGNLFNSPYNNSFVLVHGTNATKESLKAISDDISKNGAPVHLSTYQTIKAGDLLEKSALKVSKDVNISRIKSTKQNLTELKTIKDDPEKLKKYFKINTSFCNDEQTVDKVVKLIPAVIDKVEELTKKDNNELLNSFSTRTKKIETELADQIKETNFGSWSAENKDKLCDKAAIEIMDLIAPKTVLVGHSMGGLVNHLIALNPKKGIEDVSPFTYDAGNGISTVISISSPLKNGLNSNSTNNLLFDVCNENMLNPIEEASCGLLALNPFYQMMKTTSKASLSLISSGAIKALSPFIHSASPGYKQVEEDSEFIKQYIKGKKTPENVSSLSLYHKEDGFVDQTLCTLDETRTNQHNVKADVKISKADWNKATRDNPGIPKTLYYHLIMIDKPKECSNAFKKQILNNPDWTVTMLDLKNSDNTRRQCLDVIYEHAKQNPAFLKDNDKLSNKIKQVQAEKMPFENSPSYRADQILKLNKK